MEDALTYTDSQKDLVCRANTFIRHQYQKMGEFMTLWLKLWEKTSTIERIIYDKEDVEQIMGVLYACLQITHPNEFRTLREEILTNCFTRQEVDMTPKGKQEMEMNNRQRQEVDIFKRDTSFLSYIVGDGMEIEKTQSILNELTKIFNSNFHNIGKDEELLRQKLNQLITNENMLNRQESALHKKLQILQINDLQIYTQQ